MFKRNLEKPNSKTYLHSFTHSQIFGAAPNGGSTELRATNMPMSYTPNVKIIIIQLMVSLY